MGNCKDEAAYEGVWEKGCIPKEGWCCVREPLLADQRGIVLVLLCQALALLLHPESSHGGREGKLSMLAEAATLESVGIIAAVLWLSVTGLLGNTEWYGRNRGSLIIICHAAISMTNAVEVHRFPNAPWTNALLYCTAPSLASALSHSGMWPELFSRLAAQVVAFGAVLLFLGDRAAISTSLPLITATSLASGLLASCWRGDAWSLEINPLQYAWEGRLLPPHTKAISENVKPRVQVIPENMEFNSPLLRTEPAVTNSPSEIVSEAQALKTVPATSLIERETGNRPGHAGLQAAKQSINIRSEKLQSSSSQPLRTSEVKLCSEERCCDAEMKGLQVGNHSAAFRFSEIGNRLEGSLDALSEETMAMIQSACEAVAAAEEAAAARSAAEKVVIAALKIAELEKQVVENRVAEAKNSVEQAMRAIQRAAQASRFNEMRLNGAIVAELMTIAASSKGLQEEALKKWFMISFRAMKKISLLRNGADRGCLREVMVAKESSRGGLEKIDSEGCKLGSAGNCTSYGEEKEQHLGDSRSGSCNMERFITCRSSLGRKWLPAAPGRRRWVAVRREILLRRSRVKIPAAKLCFLLARQRSVEAAIEFERFCSPSQLPDELYLRAEEEIESFGYEEAVKEWRHRQGEAIALECMQTSSQEGEISAAIVLCRNVRVELAAMGIAAVRREPWLALEHRYGRQGLLLSPLEACLPPSLWVNYAQTGLQDSRTWKNAVRSSWLAEHFTMSGMLESMIDSVRPELGPSQKQALRTAVRDMDRVEAAVRARFEELCQGIAVWLRGAPSAAELDPSRGPGALIATLGERVEGLFLEAADRHFQLFEFCRAVLVPRQMASLLVGFSEHIRKLGHVGQLWELKHAGECS